MSGIRIHVTRAGRELAIEAARIRQRSNEGRGLWHKYGLADDAGTFTHRIGALGEVAIFELLGADPEPILEERNREDYRNADLDPDVWIRSALGTYKRLFLTLNDREHAHGRFLWAPIESHELGIVVFKGWIYGHEGLRRRYWRQVRSDRPAQFYVDDGALRSPVAFVKLWERGKVKA